MDCARRFTPACCLGVASAWILFAACCLPTAAAQRHAEAIRAKPLAIQRSDTEVNVKHGDQLLVCYRYGRVPKKPYVAQLTSPSGAKVLRDAPVDHLHHHGLMFAWTVDGVNFWEESPTGGVQVHRGWKNLRVEGGGRRGRAVLQEELAWNTPDGESLVEETRTLIVRAPVPGRPRLLTWHAEFTAGRDAPATLTIGGTEYHGLGVRFVKAMDTRGLHFNSAGGEEVAGTNGKPAKWSAYTAEVAPARSVTVAVFNHPANPRHPSEFFTMGETPPFAYLSNTLGVGTEPLRLRRGEKMSVCFGVAVFDGSVDSQGVNACYRAWLQLPPGPSPPAG